MSWIFLSIAGLLEIIWAYFLKLSDGLTKLNYSIISIICMLLSFYFLSLATKTLPIGVSYAIWTGIGVIGTSIIGIIVFKEVVSMPKIIFATLIIIGIIGLRFFSEK